MSSEKYHRIYRENLREQFLDWFEGFVDSVVERKYRETEELVDWLEQSPPDWLRYPFAVLREGFSCWLLGRFMATVLTCQAACEAMLADLFEKSEEDEKKTVKKYGGNWKKLKESPMICRLWILYKEEIVSKEIYDGLRQVRRLRNKIAHEGTPQTLEEILKSPWVDAKKAEEQAWRSLNFAVLLYEKIFIKYPAGPYREQLKEKLKKQREEWEKNVYGF